jgi:protein-disulfide isomerase
MPRKGHFCFEIDANQTKFERAARAKQKSASRRRAFVFSEAIPNRRSRAKASNTLFNKKKNVTHQGQDNGGIQKI